MPNFLVRPSWSRRTTIALFGAGVLVAGVISGAVISRLLPAAAKDPEEAAAESREPLDRPPAAARNQAPPPKAAPQPKTPLGRAGRKEYVELATALSQDYLLDGADAAREPQKPGLEKLAKSASEQGIQRAAALFLDAVKSVERKELESKQATEEQRQHMEQAWAEAERRHFMHKETVEREEYVGGERRIVTREVDVEDSPFSWIFNRPRSKGEGEMPPQLAAVARRIAQDGSRSGAWDELLPNLPERLAGAPSKSPLVKIEFLADGPGGKPISSTIPRPEDSLPGRSTFLGRHVARNLAGRDLHNVTLAVELFHYSTLPDATLRHVYFVPLWKKGATLELSRNFVPDPKRGGRKYHVQALELEPDGRFSLASELSTMAGVVRMQAALWSDEARQAPTTMELPERARIVAARLVKVSEKRVMSIYAVTSPSRAAAMAKNDRKPTGKTPEESTQMMLEDLLRPVLAFMPAESDSAVRAKRMLDDFQSVRTELFARKDRDLVAVCAEGKRYTASFSRAGIPYIGKFGILFLSCDAAGTRIRAEVFDPEHPQRRRLVAGFIANVTHEHQTWILLEPFPGEQGQPTSKEEEQTTDVHSGIRTYRFRLSENHLMGEASRKEILPLGGADGSSVKFQLEESPGDAKELAAAKQRERAAPREQPREPLAEIAPPPSRKPSRAAMAQGANPPAGASKTESKTESKPDAKKTLSRTKPATTKSDDKGADPARDAKPETVTRVTVDNVEYVYQGTVREGANVLVNVLATSQKGDRAAPKGQMTLVDDDGERYTGSLTDHRADLREGVPVKLTWRFGKTTGGKSSAPSAKITRFKLVSIKLHRGGGGDSLDFQNVPAKP